MLSGKTTDKEWARREAVRAYMKRRVVSEETKKRISEGKKGQTPWIAGRKHTDEAKEKIRQRKEAVSRPIKCIELDKVWNNPVEAEKELGIPRKQIKKSANPFEANKKARGLTFVWI